MNYEELAKKLAQFFPFTDPDLAAVRELVHEAHWSCTPAPAEKVLRLAAANFDQKTVGIIDVRTDTVIAIVNLPESFSWPTVAGLPE